MPGQTPHSWLGKALYTINHLTVPQNWNSPVTLNHSLLLQSSCEMHLPRARVWVQDLTTISGRARVSSSFGVVGTLAFPQTLEDGGYLQGVFALTGDTKSRMWPTGNIWMMIRMPIIRQMVLLQVENECSIFSFLSRAVNVDKLRLPVHWAG